MTARRPTVAGATLLTALVAALVAALLTPGATSHATPAAEDRHVAAQRTRLAFTVEDCEGCELQLVQARGTLDADVVPVWSSQARPVEDGTVVFRVPTRRTRGMSVTVRAPWEGHTGYRTTVAWRYDGERVGDLVTLEDAVTKRRASACWQGTRRRDLTVPLVVEEVEVDGVHRRVPGSIAFVPTTRRWLSPMRRVWDGVLGSQDVNLCADPARHH